MVCKCQWLWYQACMIMVTYSLVLSELEDFDCFCLNLFSYKFVFVFGLFASTYLLHSCFKFCGVFSWFFFKFTLTGPFHCSSFWWLIISLGQRIDSGSPFVLWPCQYCKLRTFYSNFQKYMCIVHTVQSRFSDIFGLQKNCH